MGLSLQAKVKWMSFLVLLVGFLFLLIYHYDSHLWTHLIKLYNALHHPHRLKGILLSYGAYAPVAYILLQVLQIVVAPIPGGAIEFLGGYLFGAKIGFLY
ncbi:MAG: hypothetical protein EHM36_11055, partial [Deltaproteobacteria bacterium]